MMNCIGNDGGTSFDASSTACDSLALSARTIKTIVTAGGNQSRAKQSEFVAEPNEAIVRFVAQTTSKDLYLKIALLVEQTPRGPQGETLTHCVSVITSSTARNHQHAHEHSDRARERDAQAKKVQKIKGLKHEALLPNEMLQLEEAAPVQLRLLSLFRVLIAAQRLSAERVIHPPTPASLPGGAVTDANERAGVGREKIGAEVGDDTDSAGERDGEVAAGSGNVGTTSSRWIFIAECGCHGFPQFLIISFFSVLYGEVVRGEVHLNKNAMIETNTLNGRILKRSSVVEMDMGSPGIFGVVAKAVQSPAYFVLKIAFSSHVLYSYPTRVLLITA